MNSTQSRYHETLRIGAQHPSLAGHFPGNPIVPGVLLLERVAAALEHWRGAQVASIAHVKFLHPLRPEQNAELTLDGAGTRVQFRIVYNDRIIASGTLESAP